MKKHKRKEFSFPILLLMGAGFALGTLGAVVLALSIISYFTKDPTALTGAFSLLSLVIAGAVSAFVTAKVWGEGGALIAILSAAICAIVMLAIGLIWRGGLLPFGVLLNIAAFLAASALSATLAKKKKKAHRGRY